MVFGDEATNSEATLKTVAEGHRRLVITANSKSCATWATGPSVGVPIPPNVFQQADDDSVIEEYYAPVSPVTTTTTPVVTGASTITGNLNRPLLGDRCDVVRCYRNRNVIKRTQVMPSGQPQKYSKYTEPDTVDNWTNPLPTTTNEGNEITKTRQRIINIKSINEMRKIYWKHWNWNPLAQLWMMETATGHQRMDTEASKTEISRRCQ
ncbi:uncharacterized protein LOC128266931 [Anopheles cruzii]|uniref:uncharacterized protein LOC128266931 n=1 Tax=Anopheles cruzii TaxID=68878 RepID=UPI0022EC6FAD|nr:uncharacterized protein LOC128266931 [Anopheles cruzii]